MLYFTEEFNSFFKQLAANNHKDWFALHRKEYETHIKKPFLQLVKDLIETINEQEFLDLEPKNAVYRVNNDIRFNKNRPLYKTHVGAAIVSGGRKNISNPGLYIHLSPGESFIASGIYLPDKETLYKIRLGITQNLEQFQKLKNEETFISSFGRFADSKVNKIIPKEFKEAAIEEPLLFNKQFYYIKSFDEGENIVLKEDLLQFIMNFYQKAKPMNDFLKSIS